MKYLSIFIILFLSTLLVNGQIIQKGSSQVLLKGKVADKLDGKPEGVEIRFEDENGKFFKINSNSLTGNYEQILESGKKYKIRLTSKNIFPLEFPIETEKTKNYLEQTADFDILRLEQGRAIDCSDLFSSGSANLQSNAKSFFDDLNLKMRFNRNVKLSMEVHGCDSRNAFVKITQPKSKKKKADTTFLQKGYDDLVQQRVSTLEKEIPSLSQFVDRIEVKPSSNVGLESHKEFKSFSDTCDVIIRIKEFKETIK